MKIKRHIGNAQKLKNALVFVKDGHLLAVVAFSQREPNECYKVTVVGKSVYRQCTAYTGKLGRWLRPAHPSTADNGIGFNVAHPKEPWAGQAEVHVTANEDVTVYRAETKEGKQWLAKLK